MRRRQPNAGQSQRTGTFMDERIESLLHQIGVLEDELKNALRERESPLHFHIKGKRVEFEQAVKTAHRKLKVGLMQWLVTSRPQNFLTAPFIYALIIPFSLLDLFVSIYQAVCFRIYRIERVKRADYIAIDRGMLGYLNAIEKMHCVYCEYVNGLLAYVTEIAARTEQYWCPIKHAHKVLGTHARYQRFLEYGDAENYQRKLEEIRSELTQEDRNPPA